ncbi:endoplasmin homolog [Phtheirospermum japonicum]|uniref:Endoplasmin homolog n=1 Tax=Phtheirospermum japonicum TaxID=374723 RepID=A0A830DDS2_9LAMI|nr:endoplasmin homolog [Phtheirospermum japonicum]
MSLKRYSRMLDIKNVVKNDVLSPPPAASSNLHLILPESPPYLPVSLMQLIKTLLLIFRIEQQGEVLVSNFVLSSEGEEKIVSIADGSIFVVVLTRQEERQKRGEKNEEGSCGGRKTCERRLKTAGAAVWYSRGMEESPFLERLTKKNYEELIVIDDLLSALVGIEGRYILIRRVYGKDDSANFQVDASMDLELQESAKRIIPQCESYLQINQFVESRSHFKSGLDYQAMVAQLEHQFCLRKLSAQGLWFYCQPMMGSMKALSILIKKASAANFIGSAVLNLLQSQAKAMAGDHVVRSLLEKMSQSANQAYLGILESSKSDGKLTSLDQYISRMKFGQKDIFYITGTNKEQLEKSPFPERLTKKNYEVIFFTDPVDEYLMQYLMDYDDMKFQNVSKEGLKIGKESKDKELKEAFKELTKWWKGALASENVDDVKISNRLADTPCVVVTSKYGWSANMKGSCSLRLYRMLTNRLTCTARGFLKLTQGTPSSRIFMRESCRTPR